MFICTFAPAFQTEKGLTSIWSVVFFSRSYFDIMDIRHQQRHWIIYHNARPLSYYHPFARISGIGISIIVTSDTDIDPTLTSIINISFHPDANADPLDIFIYRAISTRTRISRRGPRRYEPRDTIVYQYEHHR